MGSMKPGGRSGARPGAGRSAGSSPAVSVSVERRAFDRDLARLVDAMDSRELTTILVKEAQPMLRAAKANLAPNVRTGMLQRFEKLDRGRYHPGVAQVALGVKKGGKVVTVKPKRRRGRPRKGVRIAKGYTRMHVPSKIAHLISGGFRHVRSGKKIAGTHFQEKAVAQHKEGLIRGFIATIRRRWRR